MQTMRVSSKGWVVIPKDLRRKYRLEPGTRVAVVDYAGILSIVPISRDPISTLRGMLRGGRSLTEAIVEEHRLEREREERRSGG